MKRKKPDPDPIADKPTLTDLPTDQGTSWASPTSRSPLPRIPNYRVLRKLGEGAMGEVYEAEQLEPVRRSVALKVIKAGMDTKQVVARFESERQALALMDHPSIARVFDAGMTDVGRPFIAMEYAKGVPITDYCDTHKLGLRARLELFILVCEGVQHAHHKGVIHRDIKPTNVLVRIQDNRPVPVIIDFGVAKAMQHSLTQTTLFTELGQFIGTPEYMSPEQAEMSGLDIDTRSDVYSLGVLLYQLLVGALPFDSKRLRKGGIDDIRRTIRDEEPDRPSTRVTTLGGSGAPGGGVPSRTDYRSLSRELSGDLDWITMKALEKDRTRRYASANELAMDIERHLNHHPVLAGPPGKVYRLQKFLRRHKLGVTAAGFVLLALLLGLAGTGFGLIQARQAEFQARQAELQAVQDAARAEKVSQLLIGLFEVSDPSEARGNTITAREILDRAAERIEGDLDEQPVIRAALMSTIGEVYQNLGLYSEAEPLLASSLESRRELLGNDHPDTLASITNMGDHLYDVGKLDEAEAYYREALEGHRRVLGNDHPDTLVSINDMGALLQAQGNLEEAERYTREALEGRRRTLGDKHPQTLTSLNDLGWLLHDMGRLEEAEAYYREALAGQRRVSGNDHPSTLTVAANLGFVLQDQGEYEEAEQYLREAMEGDRRVLGNDHPNTLISIGNLGYMFQAKGSLEEAERYIREAVEGSRRVLGDRHSETLTSINNLAFLLQTQGKLQQAEPLFREAMEGYVEVLGDEHRLTLNAMANLGDLYTSQESYSRAEKLLARASRTASRVLPPENPTRGMILRKYGRCLTGLERYQEAEAALLEAHTLLTGTLGEDHPQTLKVVGNLVELYEAANRTDDAALWRAGRSDTE